MWASLVKAAVPAPAAEPEVAASTSTRVAIVDANAIISGLQLHHVADRFITTQDVLDEIRDKHARQFLANLTFTLEVQEPEESSLKTVTAFARETGDLHALSRTDLRLLALAHGMEVAANGTSHLRQHPVQASVKPKHKSKGRALPGWGTVPNPQDWAAMDELPDSAGQGSSRIRSGVQALDAVQEDATPGASIPQPTAADPTSTTDAGQTIASTTDAVAASSTSTLPFASFGAAAAADLAVGPSQPAAAAWFPTKAEVPAPPGEAKPADPYAGVGHFAGVPMPPAAPLPGASEVGDDDDDDDAGEDGEWEQAGKSRGADRRRRRNQARYEARQARRQEGNGPPGDGPGVQGGAGARAGAVTLPTPAGTVGDASFANGIALQSVNPGASVGSDVPGETALVNGVATNGKLGSAHAAESQSGEEEEEEDETDEGEEEEQEGEEEEGEEEEAGEGEEEEEGGEGAPGEGEEGASSTVGAATTASGTDCGEFTLNTTSNVACVTADFAMQNVLMQMGLRLVTRDGKQISRLSRWAVRCSACFFVTKEAGRLFCPRCGNMTLDRVEVTVGPEGAEFYGVRKKHVLRGTIFSLPKPKGGRAANLIMREDELLHKLKPRRKKKAAQQDLDPYAPQHGTHEAWQLNLASGQEVLANTKGAAFLMAGWKHNPNERKPVASNRRRK